jgi:hypothetical protein
MPNDEQLNDGPPVKNDSKTEELLKRIRERYHRAKDYWADIQKEAATDMRYIAGDPWDGDAKSEREDAGRPALSLDELNQYLNQAENNMRQNPRGIKVEPAGDGATDDTAEFEQGLIRDIEYASSAPRNAYAPAYMGALQRSYGFFKITRKYKAKSFDQEISIEGVTDPDTIIFDPDVIKADWSDSKFAFEHKPLTKEEFKRQYPKAKIQSFSAADTATYPDWVRSDHVVVAAYWEVEVTEGRLLLIEGGDEGPQVMDEDELPEGMDRKTLKAAGKILKERSYDKRSVKQYITNGLEILNSEEEQEQPGEHIPIIPVLGKEIWVNDGGTSRRVLTSLVRLARDAQMLFNYYCSQEAEEASKTPQSPFVGAKGQFESDKGSWENLSRQPRAYVQYDVVTDATGQAPLPAPSRPQYVPNFQQWEIAKDSCRRSIQSAMGINPLPSAAQRNNEKSGVALERIESQEQIGSFHFTDNFDRALEFAGRVVESWIPVVYDTQRTVAVRAEDGEHRMVDINTPEPVQTPDGGQYHYTTGAQHRVTISTGPSFKSAREDAADFLDTLLKVLPTLPLAPPQMQQLLSLGIQMRQLGPIGDKMAAIIKGDPNDPATQAHQAQAQLQQAGQAMQQMQQELQKLMFERQAKVLELQAKGQQQQAEYQRDISLQKLKLEHDLAMAEINTKAQQLGERVKFVEDLWAKFHDQAHDVALSAQEHGQNLAQAAQQHDQAMQQGAASAQQQQALSAQNAAQTAAQAQAEPPSSPAGA